MFLISFYMFFVVSTPFFMILMRFHIIFWCAHVYDATCAHLYDYDCAHYMILYVWAIFSDLSFVSEVMSFPTLRGRPFFWIFRCVFQNFRKISNDSFPMILFFFRIVFFHISRIQNQCLGSVQVQNNLVSYHVSTRKQDSVQDFRIRCNVSEHVIKFQASLNLPGVNWM